MAVLWEKMVYFQMSVLLALIYSLNILQVCCSSTILNDLYPLKHLGSLFKPVYFCVAGIFTAPINGAYYIRLTSCDNTESHGMAVHLYKNNKKMNTLAKYSQGFKTYFSSGLVMQLEAGDIVYTKLPSNSKLYGDEDNGTTFSGFLLFPM